MGELLCAGMKVPLVFVNTTGNYAKFINQSGITDKMLKILSEVRLDDTSSTNEDSCRVRELFEKNQMPEDVKKDFKECYIRLCEKNNVGDIPVADKRSGLKPIMKQAISFPYKLGV